MPRIEKTKMSKKEESWGRVVRTYRDFNTGCFKPNGSTSFGNSLKRTMEVVKLIQ